MLLDEIPLPGRRLEKGGKCKGKGKQGKPKEEEDPVPDGFSVHTSYRKGGGMGKTSGKADSSSASKANTAEEEVEEEEAEDDALLTEKEEEEET